MDRDGDEEVAADAGPAPASGEEGAQERGKAPFAAVLEDEDDPASDAGIGGDPLQLEEGCRDPDGESDGDPRRCLEACGKGCQTTGAEELVGAATAGTAGRKGEVEDLAGEGSKGGHGPQVSRQGR
jgi:hypothetical protein